MLAYGVGARTQKGTGPAVDICSMTGDYLDPYVESPEELRNCYDGSLGVIQISGPVNYKAIVKYVCDLAQLDYGTVADVSSIRNYYVLTILMAGLIDDIDDSVNEILRAAELPISVQIIKIGGISDSDNDFGTLIERTRPALEQCDRNFIDMHDFDRYKVKEKVSGSEFINEEKLQLDLMRNIPEQIEKFFEIQHFDFDNSNALLQSPAKTSLNSSDTSSQQNYQIQAALDGEIAAMHMPLSPHEGGDEEIGSELTEDNLKKRDSLMMMDEEAKNQLTQELAQNRDQEEQMMQAARLKRVDLEIDTTEAEETKEPTVDLMQTPRSHKMHLMEQPDYKEKIKLFLEMEKLKLITQAVAIGISEDAILEAFQEESFIDFSLDNLKAIIQRRADALAEAAGDGVDVTVAAGEAEIQASESLSAENTEPVGEKHDEEQK